MNLFNSNDITYVGGFGAAVESFLKTISGMVVERGIKVWPVKFKGHHEFVGGRGGERKNDDGRILVSIVNNYNLADDI